MDERLLWFVGDDLSGELFVCVFQMIWGAHSQTFPTAAVFNLNTLAIHT